MVRRQVAVIVATTTPAALAAKAATTTIPIVFFVADDPVELGTCRQPEPARGQSYRHDYVDVGGPKRLELLHEMVPTATIIALLINPTSPNLAEAQARDLQTAARTLGLQIHVLHASADRDFEDASRRGFDRQCRNGVAVALRN